MFATTNQTGVNMGAPSKAELAYWSARENEYETAKARGVCGEEGIEMSNAIYQGVLENASLYADMFGVSTEELLSFHKH